MGFRFRRRLRLFKGAWINLSKKGSSLSLGGKGFTENISRRRRMETVSLPGSGISYRTRRHRFRKVGGLQTPVGPRVTVTPARFLAFIALAAIITWISAMDAGFLADILWSLATVLVGFLIGWDCGRRHGERSGWNIAMQSTRIWQQAKGKERL
jgi:hypothetical protein